MRSANGYGKVGVRAVDAAWVAVEGLLVLLVGPCSNGSVLVTKHSLLRYRGPDLRDFFSHRSMVSLLQLRSSMSARTEQRELLEAPWIHALPDLRTLNAELRLHVSSRRPTPPPPGGGSKEEARTTPGCPAPARQ